MPIARERLAYPGAVVNIAVNPNPGWGSAPDLWPSVGEYACYDPMLYHSMTFDLRRNKAFRSALGSVAAGRTVLDIGTGQDLTWALEAARLGASTVIAIEEIEDAYERAAEKLGQQDADVILLRGSSFGVTVPRRADVCVAEIIGSIASAEGMIAVLADARSRLLVPGADVVPAVCKTLIGAVCLRSMFPAGLAFSVDAMPYLRSIFGSYRRPFDIRLAVANPDPAAVVSTTGMVEDLAFGNNVPLDDRVECRLEMLRDDVIDGLLCWIELWAGGSAEPVDSLNQSTSWIPVYVPLFADPVAVRAGDVLAVDFRRSTSDDGVHPDYEFRASLMGCSQVAPVVSALRHHGDELGTSAVHRELFGTRDDRWA